MVAEKRTFWGRVLLIGGMAVTAMVGFGLAPTLRGGLVDPWFGLTAVGTGVLIIACGTAAGVFGFAWWQLWRQHQEDRKWQAVKEEVEHTEKVEALGEAIGGLAIAVEERRHGALTVSEQSGGLALADRKDR